MVRHRPSRQPGLRALGLDAVFADPGQSAHPSLASARALGGESTLALASLAVGDVSFNEQKHTLMRVLLR